MDNNCNRKRKMDDNCDNSNKSKKMLPFSSPMKLFTFIKDNNNNNTEMKDQNETIDLPLGHFQMLPQEILVKILKYLTIEELSILTMVNSRICQFIIENFLLGKSGLNFFLNPEVLSNYLFDPIMKKAICDKFSSAGLLLKRCTFLIRTSDRVQMLIHLFKNSYGVPSIKILSYFDYLSFKLVIKCYGKIINKLIRGWGDFECEYVFKTLKDLSEIDLHIHKFLDSSLGSRQKQELMIRNFFRMICTQSEEETWDSFKDKLNWLLKVLNAFEPQDVAKLLIVIFGPLVRINNSSHSLPYVAWWDLTDSIFHEAGLEELGNNFFFLFKQCQNTSWSKEYLLRIFETVIATPATWSYCNVSILLYHSGFDLSTMFLIKKFKDGRVPDVAHYICYLALVTQTNSGDFNPIIGIIDLLIEEDGSEELIEEIVHGFSTIAFDAEIPNDEHQNVWGLLEIIDTQLEMLKLLFLRLKYFKKCL